MSNKKDLTRIEDLGEFLHEAQDEGVPSFEAEESESPAFEGTTSFGDENSAFEETPSFEQTSSFEESPSFEESTTFEESSPFDEVPVFKANEDQEVEEPTFSAFEDSEETEEAVVNQVEEVSFIPETPPPVYAPEPSIKAPETFEEVKKFAESTSFTGMGVEGNPSFSVLLKHVRYVEDVSDIISLLRELGLLSDGEDQTRARLMRGHLLVPRISEYAAILLAHKLRRFDIDIQVGLSDEIHPPKHHEAPEVGLVSKHNLYQNQTHHFKFEDARLELSQIIVAATPTLEGYQVVRYLGVASEHQMLEGSIVEDEISDEVPRYYHELAQKLKAHALKGNANAVVGLNYQLTPLPSEYGHSIQKYRLSCTGNLVWVKKL